MQLFLKVLLSWVDTQKVLGFMVMLELAEDFPELLERNQDVQGLAAELLARRQQQRFLAQSAAPREAPGCLLGWLLPRRR